MDRRDFLSRTGQTSLFLGLSSLMGPMKTWAQTAADEWYFVQIQLSGGWDVTLGTDPWLTTKPEEKEMFIEYDPSNIERVGDVAFGPSMLPLKPYADRMAVLNGIFMSGSDNGHGAAENYILSGTTQRNWGLLPVEISECRPGSLFGILNNQGIYSGARSPITTSVSSIGALAGGTSDPDFTSDENAGNRLSDLQKQLGASEENLRLMRERLKNFQNAGIMLQDEHYVAAAFSAGLSRLCLYQNFGQLDTHANHPGTHQTEQKKGWEKVAGFLSAFQKVEIGRSGVSLFDRTTFFITSEFARTAALNTSSGKDHNPGTNSVVLMGPNIKGGRVIGGSHLVSSRQSKTGMSYHIASPIDLQTGRALDSRENATIVRPENVAATVVDALGISRRRFAPVSPKIESLHHLLR